MFKFSKTTIIASVAVVTIVIAGGAYYFNQKNQPPAYETTTVERRDLEQSVAVTGKVVAAEEIALAFEKGGRIGSTNVEVGDVVEKGTVLASLSAQDAQASVAEARANVTAAEAGLNRYRALVAAAQADLAKLEKGSREEEITLARSKVTKAEQALNSAKQELADTKAVAELDLMNLYEGATNLIADAFNDAENAVQQQASQFFNEPYGRPILNFTTGDTRAQNSAETYMQLSEAAVDELRILATKNLTSGSETDEAINTTLEHLSTINTLLFNLTATLNTSNTLSDATEAEYASDIASARASINTDITNLNNRQQAIASQKIANNQKINSAESAVASAEDSLNIAKNELSITEAGATTEQLDSARATLNQAEANLSVQQAEVSRAYATLQRQTAELSKTNLVAPFRGIITDLLVTTGEIIPANTTAVSMISDGEFEIEAFVPESDIANIKVGDIARFTLDAFNDSKVFEATVSTIDPAETITNGIATYKTKLAIGAENTEAKPGMTADVVIVTNFKENVLSIPFRSVDRANNTVTILENSGMTVKKKVEIGLQDRAGLVEIISGLDQGETVVLGLKEE